MRVAEKVLMIAIHCWGPFYPLNMIAGYWWFIKRGVS